MSTATAAMKQNPFAPSTTAKPTTSPKDSSKDVTIPALPELHDPMFLDKLLPAKPAPTPAVKPPAQQPITGAAFMAALNQASNRKYTQNSAHAFESTLSPTIDAFNGLSQATDPSDVEPLLRKSWEVDPLLTVKLIFNLRSIHEGKSEREGFYRAWGWLYRNHPRTAIINLSALVDPLIERKLKEKKEDEPAADEDDGVLIDAEGEVAEEKNIRGKTHGYWKDLLNLLILAAEGELDSGAASFNAIHPPRTPRSSNRGGRGRHQKNRPQGRNKGPASQNKQEKNEASRDERVMETLKANAERSNTAKLARDKAHAESRTRIQKLFERSKPFKALYIAVARQFAQGLEADIEILEKIADSKTDDKNRIDLSFQLSLCSKYAPSLGASHDRSTNIASAIAELLWIKGKLRVPYEQTQVLTVDKVHDLRGAYTRWILSPLRRFLQIPEIYMAHGRWNEMPYKRVASKCMQNNKKLFFKHDEARFSKYLQDVASGKRSISGGTLLPHSLLREALAVKGTNSKEVDPAAEAEVQVIEAQWKTMVEMLKESGTLDNSMAVCDVSGSMGSLRHAHGHNDSKDPVRPIWPAVALSIVLAQISREPWANRFITFSENPQIVKIDPTAGLVETARAMNSADWGMNTDFNAVFTKLILPLAIEHKLPKEEMIKRLFVFSDMEFDESTTTEEGAWTSEHEKVAKAFEDAGYDVPEIVYWNLQGARGAKPIKADWEGVALMSGFSSNMLKTFMDGGEIEEEELEEVAEEGEDGMIVVNKKAKKRMNPEEVMKKALNKPSYATLVVVD